MHAAEKPPSPPSGCNRLARELSPYLLQHARNPVDWYPWGEEAFARAREEDKPVFLSAGYSTCHWCHVMERECFARDDVAALLNAHFVPVKVDREERPDVDEIYMHATQLIAGSGGWPNSVWLTPDRRPWYAGTYFPREDHPRGPGFLTVLRALAAMWTGRRAEVEEYAARVWEALRGMLSAPVARGGVHGGLLAAALAERAAAFDHVNGGFGAAPKFPPHASLQLIAAECRRRRDPGLLALLTRTLDAMAAGGIHDHVGGGFHRYAVDAAWRVPHFEKMLYDNAQLARAYTDGWLLAGDASYRRIAGETCEWVLREMTSPEGAFYSALDADSEGEEGTYYLWRAEEIEAILGPEEAAFFGRVFPIAEEGNFEEHGAPHGRGLNVLYRETARPEPGTGEERDAVERRIAACLLRLRDARAARVGPQRDEKIIAAWNGLMLGSLAYAGRHLGETRLVAAAERAADFILTHMRAGGRLLHSFMGGRAHIDAFLDDYACLAGGLLDLYEATGRRERLEEARALAGDMLARFADEAAGGFFHAARDAADRLLPSKTCFDGPTPSGNAAAAQVLIRIGALAGDARLLELGARTVAAFAGVLDRHPAAAEGLLAASALHEEVAGGTGAAPPSPAGARGPRCTIEARASALAPGGAGEITIRLAIDEGWHVAAHAPGAAHIAPASVVVEGVEGLAIGEPIYPEGRAMLFAGDPSPRSVYAGLAEIRVPIAATADAAAGTRVVSATVAVQPCSDRACDAPAAITLAIPVTIAIARP
ncbi:MAG TPA: thioredoxin domain-containing protein [Planctomycetes bacterium]|nr:thioredoxin domain-containing protein [Planctomycetota bacterium]